MAQSGSSERCTNSVAIGGKADIRLVCPATLVRNGPSRLEPYQLAQAMAAFGGDAADDSNSVFLGDDTSQQTFLTTPHA